MPHAEKQPYLAWLAAAVSFAVAFAYVEAAVVVYLREIIYPLGFTFPLKTIPMKLIIVELAREAATMIMIVAVAFLCGRRFWSRFGYFLIIFGVWDIFYYIWLKAAIDWPHSLLEWDILFLIPLPWIAPVVAPVLVSLLMIICGFVIVRLYACGRRFAPNPLSWIATLMATGLILFSFMRDTAATLGGRLPQPYWYSLLVIGLILYAGAFWITYRATNRNGHEPDPAG